jgi:hypothetical protein
MEKPSDGLFQKGNQLGRGRPQGSRNKATLALQEFLDGYGEHITRQCIAFAIKGDPTAMRLCMERLFPPRKECPVTFDLGPITTAAQALVAASDVLQMVADGVLTPNQGATITTMIETIRRVIGTDEHEARISELESHQSECGQDEDRMYRPPKAA